MRTSRVFIEKEAPHEAPAHLDEMIRPLVDTIKKASAGAVLAQPESNSEEVLIVSLVAPVSPSPTKDVFSIDDSNRNTNWAFVVKSFHGTRSHD